MGDGRETEALANLSAIKKEVGIVGMLADSLVPIHPVFSTRPSFSCPTKFTTRFSFLTIVPHPFSCGILGKISMHDGPSIARLFLPPRHYRGGTNVRGSESFARDSSRRQVFTLFRRFSFHVYHRCWESFLFVLFCLRFFPEMSFFFCGLIFLSGIREGKIVRGKKWRMKYRIILEVKCIWLSLEVEESFGKENLEIVFFSNLLILFFWNLKITRRGKFVSEIYFIFRKWNVFNVFWWKGLIFMFVKFTIFCPLACNLIKMIIFVKWMEKFEYIRLYRFF